ncbi:SDR family NAD(P)-dependent oxidoreductase [Oceanibium sediminis]|uniref:SDR family NAD(P)-dependent oxidoreductase n=1 Tax=Oceanibium sediminis TaxID=2026339 RepID=UPI000DD48A95|nr:SDR family NAD(P)-dependent oxidoreductase [Oceanibium sediminis]
MSRVVLITGAGSGIGLASARAFAAAGDQVVCADLTLEAAEAAAEKIGGLAGIAMDVTDESQVVTAVAEVVRKHGRIDVLHANAGVSNMKPAVELSVADWDFNFNVNAKGVFLSNREVVKHFLARGEGGVIVNTASLASKVGAPLLAHYSASKFAVIGWTQALAREHAKDGIRVNAVCPGFVKTPMQDREVAWEAELRGITPEQVIQDYVDQTPLGRLETAEDVADVVVFLASDGARFMTGQGINVTGGVYMT